jgi:type I restriction enzyme M protein
LVDLDEVKENIASIKEELKEVEKQMQKYLDELGL